MEIIKNILYLLIGTGLWVVLNRWFFWKQFRNEIKIDGIFYTEDKRTKLHVKGEFYGNIINLTTGEIIKPTKHI